MVTITNYSQQDATFLEFVSSTNTAASCWQLAAVLVDNT
jgi:hypothetical protein